MGTARRLYLYTVSLVSLLAFTGGVGSLLQLGLQRIEDALAGTAVVGGGMTSAQAALSIAMIAVGAPVWALHWWLARRGMRSAAADGDEDRSSAARAGYLSVVLGIALGAGVAALVSLLSTIGGRILGVGVEAGAGWSLPLAVTVVAIPVWAAHARLRWHETRTTPVHDAAAWLARLYRYLAAYAVLMLLLNGLAGLIETTLSVLVGRADFDPTGTWWRALAAGQAAAIMVGATAWAIHWREAGTAIRDAALLGEDERVTRLRAAFFGGALLSGITVVAMGAASAIASAGRLLAGMSAGSGRVWLEDVVGPPIALLPFAAAAWWLFTAVRREAVGAGPLQVRAARRLTTLLPALAGLAFLAVGLVQLLQTGLLRAGGGATESILYGENVNFQVPWYLGQALVGLVIWLPAWAAVLEARRREPETERTATASRAYLFLVVGATIVAAVPAAIAILYRILEPLLGGTPSTTPLADLAFPIAVLSVAVVGGAYHARLLLGDLAVRPVAAEVAVRGTGGPQVEAMPETVTGLSAVGDAQAAAGQTATIELVLEVPEGENAPAVIAGLESHLPPGARLRVRPAG